MTRTIRHELVGRRSELAALEASLDEAARGRVVICSVRGEMGVGRTFLVSRFSAVARERGHDVVHLGRGAAGTAAPASSPAPSVVIADDVDELDGGTRAALEVSLAAGAPLLLVTTSPGAEADNRWSTPAFDVRRLRVDLRGLSVSETSALVRDELGHPVDPRLVGELHRASAGNPAMLSALLAELPGDVRLGPKARDVRASVIPDLASSIVARVARRDPAAAELIRAAAVAGDDSELALLAHVGRLELREALAAAEVLVHLRLVEDRSTVRFRHPVLRASVLAGITHVARDAAHLRAAQYLYRTHSPAERIARHLVASQVALDERWTAGVLVQAARTAVADGRTDQALRYLELAVTVSAPDPERNVALLELVEVSLRAGAGRGVGKVAALLRVECGDEVRLQVLSRLGAALWLRGPDGGHGEVLEAVDATTAGGALAAWGLVHEAVVVGGRRLPVGLRSHVGPMAVDGVRSPLGLAASALMTFERFLPADDPAVVVGLLADAERMLADAEDLCVHPVATLAMMAVLLWNGRHDRVEELLAVHRYCRLGRENRPQQLLLSGLEGWLLRFRGQLGNAADQLSRCLDGLADFGVPRDHVLRVVVVGVLSDVLVDKGDTAAAWTLLKDHQCGGPLPAGRHYGDVLLVRARLHAAAGAFPEALRDLRDAGHRVGAGLVDWSALRWRLVGADVMHQLARHEEARSLAQEQARRADEVGDVAGRAIASRVLGAVTGGARGATLLREAAVVLERERLWLHLAHALADLGQLLAGEDRWAEADEHLGRALALAERCGAAPLVTIVRDRLSALGAGYSALGAVRDLTVRERQVLLGAMRGQRNDQLAGLLRITLRTVEIHLSNSYRKLGIRGRKEFDRLFDVPGFWSLMLDSAAGRDEPGRPH